MLPVLPVFHIVLTVSHLHIVTNEVSKTKKSTGLKINHWNVDFLHLRKICHCHQIPSKPFKGLQKTSFSQPEKSLAQKNHSYDIINID